MRKSERLRLLELELVKMRIELDILHETVQSILSFEDARAMDSGKWYNRQSRNQD